MTDRLSDAADDLFDEVTSGDTDADVTRDDIAERLDTLVNEYSVQLDQATKAIREDLLDGDESQSGGSVSEESIGDLSGDGNAVTVEATVDQLWDARSDAVAQVGLIGDPSGRVKFTAFDHDLPTLEEGQSYRFENVLTDIYDGDLSLVVNEQSVVAELDEEVEVGDNRTTVEGCLVDIKDNSGLIKRCTADDDCTRVLNGGRCAEHGEVDGEHDVRIKGVLDTGTTTQEFIMDAETTEAFAGLSVEEAVTIAKDALDHNLPGEQLRERLVGTYLSITGPEYKGYLLVDEFDAGATVSAEQVDSLLDRAEQYA